MSVFFRIFAPSLQCEIDCKDTQIFWYITKYFRNIVLKYFYMTDYEIDSIVKKLIDSPLSSYLIAKKTCITEQTIGNYRKKLTRPTAANAKLLEYFFSEKSDSTQSIFGDNNLMAGNSIQNIDNSRVLELEAIIREKDAIIAELAQTNAQLVKKLLKK